MRFKPIRGVKWLRDIVNDSSRQYGVEVHSHLPAKEVMFDTTPYSAFIKHPAELKVIDTLIEFYGDSPTSRVFPDAYAATIQDGVIISNSGMVVTPDGYVIAETASLTGYIDHRCYTMQDLANPSIDIQYQGHWDSNVLSIANPNGGYSHHLMESFFSLLWFVGKPIGSIHTAAGLNFDRIREFLEAIGVPVNYLFTSKKNQFLTAREVSFFGPSSFMLTRSETVDMVEERLVIPRRSNKVPHRKLYLEVATKAIGARNRIPKNESEVRNFLEDNGYETIDPAKLNLNEKIKIFSEAKKTIAGGGSAIANPLYFCRRNAKVGVLSAKINLARIFSNHLNHLGKLPIAGYSDLPILPVYPQFCFHNDELLNFWSVSIKTHIERFPILQQISYALDLTSKAQVDMGRFKEWFEIFSDG